MNAYELADALDAASSDMEYNYIVNDWKLLFDAATVLLQQQAEIAELKNARDYWCLQYKDVFNKLEAQQND